MFLDIFNQKRETCLDKVDQLSCPFNLFNNKKLFWLKLNQLLRQSNKQLYLNCLSALSAKIRSLHKAEKARKSRWLIKRAKNEFSVNLYKVGKKLLDPKCYCSLNVDQKALDQHKSSNLVDKNFNIPLGNLEDLPPEPSLLKKINKSSFPCNDFFEILLTRRNASPPGLNGIPYKVYKKCSKISKFLFKILQAGFKRCETLIQWRSGQELHIPKVRNPSQNRLSDIRPIALLNIEGKLFFSLVSNCLETYLIPNNKFINNSMAWDALKKIRAQKSNLPVIWLDIANGYGSIPHNHTALPLLRAFMDDLGLISSF